MVLPGGGHCVKVATLFPNQSTEDCSRKQLKQSTTILNIRIYGPIMLINFLKCKRTEVKITTFKEIMTSKNYRILGRPEKRPGEHSVQNTEKIKQ
jgi:hypothetical protein